MNLTQIIINNASNVETDKIKISIEISDEQIIRIYMKM